MKKVQKDKKIEEEFLTFFNKIYENNLIAAFIWNFKSLIDDILTVKINDTKTLLISFGFIRRITDCIYDENYSGLSKNIYFKKKMSNIFSNIRRLIRNLFSFEFIKILELFNITNIPLGENEENDNFE